MPIYEYYCPICQKDFEILQKISEPDKKKCPSCGKSKLKKQASAISFQLKGEGWYVTDFRDKGKKVAVTETASDATDTNKTTPSETDNKEKKTKKSKPKKEAT